MVISLSLIYGTAKLLIYQGWSFVSKFLSSSTPEQIGQTVSVSWMVIL